MKQKKAQLARDFNTCQVREVDRHWRGGRGSASGNGISNKTSRQIDRPLFFFFHHPTRDYFSVASDAYQILLPNANVKFKAFFLSPKKTLECRKNYY